jgi:hypothetical protein
MLRTLRLYDLHAGQTLFLQYSTVQSSTTWSDGADVQVQCGAGGVSKGREKLRSGKPVPACLHACMHACLCLCLCLSLSLFLVCTVDVRLQWAAASGIHFQYPTSMLDIANTSSLKVHMRYSTVKVYFPGTAFGDPGMS